MKLWEKNINDEKSARKAHVSSYFRALLDVANVLTCLCLVISQLSTSIKMALSFRPLVVISYHLALSLSPVIFYSSGSTDISNGGCLFISLFVLPPPLPPPVTVVTVACGLVTLQLDQLLSVCGRDAPALQHNMQITSSSSVTMETDIMVPYESTQCSKPKPGKCVHPE